MAPPEDVPARQVNNILRNLRGEHFRHARNVQRQPVATSPLSSYAHNQPTLPPNLIYPTQAPETSRTWVPGPSPPRSWQSPLSTEPKNDSEQIATNTPAWREHALSLLFSATPFPDTARPRPIYPDPSRIPQLTMLCLQLLRTACPGTDLADIVPFIPPHLRRVLARHAAIHAPLSQTELDALRGGSAHVDTELLVVGPHAALRASALRSDHALVDGAWDAVYTQDNEPPALRALAVLSSPLSAATLLAFPPTITHLALIDIPHRIPLSRLPSICPLVVLLDLSFNAWLHSAGGLEEVEWNRLRRLEVLGLRACPVVTAKLLLELNRGRWEDVKIIR